MKRRFWGHCLDAWVSCETSPMADIVRDHAKQRADVSIVPLPKAGYRSAMLGRDGQRRTTRPRYVWLLAICVGALTGVVVAGTAADAGDNGIKDESIVIWPPDTKELTADDPVVQAVVHLLPAGAQLKDARHVVAERVREDGANYVRIEASVDGVTFHVLIYLRFAEEELSRPTVVNGAKAWPGNTSSNYAYLYYLSDSGVGLYLAADGEIGEHVGAELMDLAQRAVNDPVINKIKAQP